MIKRNVYTDSIKDAVGNSPVIDQFETEYGSTYAYSSADDIITGSMITVVDRKPTVSSETRGKVGSIVVSDREATYPGYTAAEINAYPRASQRLQKLFEKNSNVFRHQRFFDSSERWYDSCLPDLFAALQHDGTHIKKLTTEKKVNALELFSGSLITLSDFTTAAAASGGGLPVVSLKDHAGKDMDALLSLSPMATFTTRSIGFVTFNVPRLNAADDPSINNEWTWSYPYEGKFNPANRLLNVNDVLGLNLATANVLPALSGPLINNIFPPGDNREPYASAPRNLPHASYNASVGGTYQINGGIVPVIHGHHGIKKIVTITGGVNSTDVNMRDGNRTWNVYDADSYFYPIGETHDETFGFSTLMMGDAFLDQKKDLGYMISDEKDALSGSLPDWTSETLRSMKDLPDWPGTARVSRLNRIYSYVTGSATKPDLIKFFFGFGDVNNMAYARHALNTSSSSLVVDVIETIQGSPEGVIPVSNFTTNNSEVGTANFIMQVPNSLILSVGGKYPWRSLEKETTAGVDGVYYHYASGSFTTGPVRWISGSSYSNDKILGSGSPNYGPAPLGAGAGEDSRMYIDIFSESPWRYKYSRGVVSGDDQSYLKSVAFRIHVHGQTDLYTSSIGNSDVSFDLYSAFDALGTYFFHDPNKGYGAVDYVTGSAWSPPGGLNLSDPESQYTSNMYPPGLWRLMFLYHNSTSGGPSDDINRAFISDLKLEVFGRSRYEPNESYKMGCNNYPDFRKKSFDARNCPKDDDYPIHYFSGSLGILDTRLNDNNLLIYTNRNRNFRSTYVGLGPIIRGWKHGLISGFPVNTSAVWRRGRYGQFRDMLEQRQYGKFVYVNSSPLDGIAIDTRGSNSVEWTLGPGPAEVSFVKQTYKRDERGIGYIYNEKVDGGLTTSQNLSTEITSSFPYVDGVARMRPEQDLSKVLSHKITSVTIDESGATII